MAKIKIMVVDDEMDIVRFIATRLRASGYDVVTASDAISATHMAVHESPDLFILDIGMPGGNGFVIADRLSKNSKTMGTPVLFMTGRVNPEDVDKAKESGAFAYLTKPVKSDILLETVARALVSVGKSPPIAA